MSVLISLFQSFSNSHTFAPRVCRYCQDCSILVFSSEWEDHQSPDVVAMVTMEMLDHPTQLILPLEERKAQAVGLCEWTLCTCLSLGGGKLGLLTMGAGDIQRVCVDYWRSVR